MDVCSALCGKHACQGWGLAFVVTTEGIPLDMPVEQLVHRRTECWAKAASCRQRPVGRGETTGRIQALESLLVFLSDDTII